MEREAFEHLVDSIAYCGLVCGLCQPNEACSCRNNNHCGKRLSPDGCHQYNCCTEKGIAGCWECEEGLCSEDMFAQGRNKLRAFVRCIKEDGLEKFASYLMKNDKKGVLYHKENSIFGDYDLGTEDAVLALLRNEA